MQAQFKQLINFDGKKLFSVKQGGSFTIPDVIATPSGVGSYSGLSSSPINVVNNRPTVGGLLFLGFSDATSGELTSTDDRIQSADLYPGDVVAVSAVDTGKITVTVTSREGVLRSTGTITATAVGGVMGFYA